MPTISLTPLGLGEVLDQTFSYFRKYFWLFAGIMVLPEGLMAGLQIVIQVLVGNFQYGAPQNPQVAAQAATSAMRVGFITMGAMIPFVIFYSIAQAATA